MIGYNVTKINELMKNLAEAYERCGNHISDGWPSVSSTLQQYWIGEDEQSYENAFCERMCEMYRQAHQIVESLNQNLESLGNSWHEFQQKNTLSGAESPTTFAVSLDKPAITLNEKIISYKAADVTDATNRGIQEGAASAIQSSMGDYLTNIKTSLQDIYNGIDGSAAFLGTEQAPTINGYIEAIGQSLGSVVTAANDIYQAVDQLTSAAYTQSESEVSSNFNATSVQADIEGQLGDMKWN